MSELQASSLFMPPVYAKNIEFASKKPIRSSSAVVGGAMADLEAQAQKRLRLERLRTLGEAVELQMMARSSMTGAEQQQLQLQLVAARAECERLADEVAQERSRKNKLIAKAKRRQLLGPRATTHAWLALEHLWRALATTVFALAVCFFSMFGLRGVSSRMSGCWDDSREAMSEPEPGALRPAARRMRSGETAAPKSANVKLLAERLEATYVAEDKWDEPGPHHRLGVWFPGMPAKKLWDLLVLWLIVYSCVVVPFRIGMR